MNNEQTTELREAGEQEKTEEPKKIKKKKSVLRKIIGWVVYIAVIAALIYYTPKALSYALGTDTPIAAITSGSMWPALKKGDLIFVKKVDSKEVKIGDIVVYKNQNGFTIHRVIEIKEDSIITKGDANNISDAPVEFKDIVGKTFDYKIGKPLRLPKMGYISIWVNQNRS